MANLQRPELDATQIRTDIRAHQDLSPPQQSVTPSAEIQADGATLRASIGRFLLGIVTLFVGLTLGMAALKLLFVFSNWEVFSNAGAGAVARAWSKGLRFDLAAAVLLLIPVFVLWCVATAVRGRLWRGVLCGYMAFLGLALAALTIADVQYFAEAGKHLTYEILAYLGPASLPVIRGAFELHPVLLSIGLVACFGAALATGMLARRLLAACIPAQGPRRPMRLLTLPVLAALGFLAVRGGGRLPMGVGDAAISPDPYLNALCLNPAYAVLMTSFSAERPYRFQTEAENVRVTRAAFGIPSETPLDPRYPLLRESSGTPQGNGLNVVLFVLESWSATDMGCLGGTEPNITPVFDQLATEGAFFKQAFATGLRTSEGMFSILCSFPNQPFRPILKRAGVLQNHWRALSGILDEAGYRNIFVHGRDLDFDNLRGFLRTIHFHKLIGREDFPADVKASEGAWGGYDDEAVMHRANAEFTAARQPFFGVIYTMNTHPPFSTPVNFPLLRPQPASDSDHYLNALHYGDYCLGSMLAEARRQPWFANTVFIFVADHARTRGQFNLSSQHHIPLLIYAPGRVAAQAEPAIASQLDILPTVLGLLELGTRHAAWGRDLLAAEKGDARAVCIAGDEVRWHEGDYLLVDRLSERARPLLFDIQNDPACTHDVWSKDSQVGPALDLKLRSYISLSQRLLNENRAYP